MIQSMQLTTTRRNFSPMKLSKILQARRIHAVDDNDGNGSWGIFISPLDPTFVVKLFFDEEQFINEKTGYDKALGDPSLVRFACRYREIDIEIDHSGSLVDSRPPPYAKALLLPYLKNPPWEEIGKLSDATTGRILESHGIEVDNVKDAFCRAGIAPWEATVFLNSDTSEVKAIDFTDCQVLADTYDMDDEDE